MRLVDTSAWIEVFRRPARLTRLVMVGCPMPMPSASGTSVSEKTATECVSAVAIRPIAVRMVWECYQLVKIPIIGMGGITDARDAIEFMLAGATAVQIGTQNFVDPFVWSKVLDGLNDYMTRHRLDRLGDLIGTFDPTPPKPVHA